MDKKDNSPQNESNSGRLSPAPIGFVVKHNEFGIGHITSIDGRVFSVNFFFPPSERKLASGIDRSLIPISTICNTVNGICVIKQQNQSQDSNYHKYRVEFENGLIGILYENELFPMQLSTPTEPLEVLSGLQHEGYPIFATREKLQQIHNEMVRHGGGVKSLLSSRIDLHSHQAYVAGTVILDNKQRYLLADEVGLGKTIEAGVVIHDLLFRNPLAKILILCPGTLVQQWFSEMYSKFSGVIFHLPEISGNSFLTKEKTKQIILSFYTALTKQGEIVEIKWDLIIIDEVHHLLRVKELYELVRLLSLQNSGLLLLSALPAQHRDQEYYDLLALLEPQKYNQNDKNARDNFSKLFERQKEIGGRIGVVMRRLSELQGGGRKQQERVMKQLGVLMQMPVLKEDQFLNRLVDNLDSSSEPFLESVHQIIYHISDYYRINRRILRNRREKLIESKQLKRIKREYDVISYLPDQYEIDALSSLDNFLLAMREAGLREEILIPLSTQLFQASTHPETLFQTLVSSEQNHLSKNSEDRYENLYDLVSYEEWDDQLKYFWKHAKDRIDYRLLQEVIRTTLEWRSQGNKENFRLKEMISLLDKKHKAHPKDKFILFAGYPRLASILAEQLSDQFGEVSMSRFYYGMDNDPILERDLKEKEVRRFRNNRQTWLLICDETGGEGRNFQFAAEIIHYDLPWQAAKIEQRIGRLDRLGRKRTDVISNLVVAKGSKEEAWINCLTQGLGIFEQSLSGLEFALRDIELSVARNLLSDDDQALWEMPPYINKRVAEERALDESQNQMDEASYERVRAEEFRKVQSSWEQEKKLEEEFIQYFKMISTHKSFKRLPQDDGSEGIVEFHPEDVRQVRLNMVDDTKSRKGTFYREIAQSRPDLEFFSIGNDFFDSVCRSLSTDPKGRTFAVECTTSEHTTWRGFEFSYRLKISNIFEDKDLGYQNILDYIFAERIEQSYVNENCELSDLSVDLLKLRSSFNNQNKRNLWKNITKNNVTLMTNFYSNWDELLRMAEHIAREHIRDRYRHILSSKINNQLDKLTEQIRKLQTATPDGWEEQTQALMQLKEAINTWDLELDTVGFLSINGGIYDA